MSNRLKTLVVAAALGTTITAVAPAMADSFGFSFDTGNVAFAYRDGYWDRYHRWHRWHDYDQWRWYRAHYRNNYYDWYHDRDRDFGWHDRGWHRGWYHHDNWRDRRDYYDRDYDRDRDKDWHY